MRRAVFFTLLFILLLCSISFGAQGEKKDYENKRGWIYECSMWRYYKDDGSFAKSEDLILDGKDYHFNSIGFSKDCTYKDPIIIPKESQKTDLEKKVDGYADSVLEEITTEDMTGRQKCRAIYNWIRSNMSYVDHAAKDDWVQGAYDGFRQGSGDCFTYYGLSVALLTRAGCDCIEVLREDGHHWWLLVNFGEGWYHFDATPRRNDGADFCLITDDAITKYAQEHTNENGYTTHRWDRSLYPSTPKQ